MVLLLSELLLELLLLLDYLLNLGLVLVQLGFQVSQLLLKLEVQALLRFELLSEDLLSGVAIDDDTGTCRVAVAFVASVLALSAC